MSGIFVPCKGLRFTLKQSMRIVFVIANSGDNIEMLLSAAFYLGLHCVSQYSMRGSRGGGGGGNEAQADQDPLKKLQKI